jgi:hypothetical protein
MKYFSNLGHALKAMDMSYSDPVYAIIDADDERDVHYDIVSEQNGEVVQRDSNVEFFDDKTVYDSIAVCVRDEDLVDQSQVYQLNNNQVYDVAESDMNVDDVTNVATQIATDVVDTATQISTDIVGATDELTYAIKAPVNPLVLAGGGYLLMKIIPLPWLIAGGAVWFLMNKKGQ